MPFNYGALRGKIREVFGTQEAFAAEMGMSMSTLSGKLRGRTEWTRAEMDLALKLLDIPVAEVSLYFFSH